MSEIATSFRFLSEPLRTLTTISFTTLNRHKAGINYRRELLCPHARSSYHVNANRSRLDGESTHSSNLQGIWSTSRDLAQKQVAFRSSLQQDPNKKEPTQLQVNCLRCRWYYSWHEQWNSSATAGWWGTGSDQIPEDNKKRKDCRNVQQYIKERKWYNNPAMRKEGGHQAP